MKIGTRKPWQNPIKTGLIDFLTYYNQEQLDAALKTFLETFSAYKGWRWKFRDNWIENYQLFRGYSAYNEAKPDWQSAYDLRLAYEFCLTILPTMLSPLYDTSPLMVAMAESEDMEKAAMFSESLLERRKDQINLYCLDQTTFLDTLIYGTAWQKVRYKVDQSYEGSFVEGRSIFDIFPDPIHADPKNMRAIFDRNVMHMDEIKFMADQGIWQNTDKIKLDDSGQNKYISQLDRLRSIGYGGNESYDLTKDYHEVLEMWGRHRADTGEYFDVVMVVVDRTTMLRFEESPYHFKDSQTEFWYATKPYAKFVDVAISDEVYGVGEIDAMKYMCYQANDLINMYMDAIQYVGTPIFTACALAIDQDIDTITLAPGTIIPVNAIPGVEPVKMLQKDGSFVASFNGVEAIRRNVRDVLGVHETQSGTEGAIRKSATEAITLAQSGVARGKLRIQYLSFGALQDRSRMMIDMERQYTDEKVAVKVYDAGQFKAFMKITPSDIRSGVDFRLAASALYGWKGLVAQQRLQYLDTVLKSPETLQLTNLPRLLKLIAESLDINERDIVIIPEKPSASPAPAPQLGGGAPNAAILAQIAQAGSAGGVPVQGVPAGQTPPFTPQDVVDYNTMIEQKLAQGQQAIG